MRRDVADVALARRVFAPHYALPLDHGCVVTAAAMRARPDADAPAVSELLLGECFAVVDSSGDWAWGFSRHDGYVGYVPIDALGAMPAPTHIVDRPAALLFAAPDIKSPVRRRLPMGARLCVDGDTGDFLDTPLGFLHRRHAARLDAPERDPVAVAARLVGTPYRWGGRSGDGIDCSGLVQLALARCGQDAPRDSDQQRETLGRAVDPLSTLERGDLVYLPGHVGLMMDAVTLLHANAHWMATVAEPLADVLARQPAEGGIVAVRRL